MDSVNMDFRRYCEDLKIANANKHKAIITDLCLRLRNCANCNTCTIENKIKELELIKIKDNSFRLTGKWDVKVNRAFLDIANRNNYDVSFIECGEDYYTEFKKIV